MMGAKARQFRPVPAVSLDELVPTDFSTGISSACSISPSCGSWYRTATWPA
jgi:hypothetical protein